LKISSLSTLKLSSPKRIVTSWFICGIRGAITETVFNNLNPSSVAARTFRTMISFQRPLNIKYDRIFSYRKPLLLFWTMSKILFCIKQHFRDWNITPTSSKNLLDLLKMLNRRSSVCTVLYVTVKDVTVAKQTCIEEHRYNLT
jgi:hypothetical protein